MILSEISPNLAKGIQAELNHKRFLFFFLISCKIFPEDFVPVDSLNRIVVLTRACGFVDNDGIFEENYFSIQDNKQPNK